MRNQFRYDALLAKHRTLEEKLEAELARPLPDSLVVQRLKRHKLLVKDEIESWERLMRAVRIEAHRLPERADAA